MTSSVFSNLRLPIIWLKFAFSYPAHGITFLSLPSSIFYLKVFLTHSANAAIDTIK